MATVVEYHRPTSLAAALELLSRPGTVALAGGAVLDRRAGTVVDLQALALDEIAPEGPGRLRLGGGARLQQLADAGEVPELLRTLARREVPSTLRSLVSVGDVVASRDAESELLAALLAHDAVVTVANKRGRTDQPIAGLLADRTSLDGAIVIAITIGTDGRAAASRTGRTPADRPIVAAVARSTDDGRVRLALTGVAGTPILADDVGAIAALAPPGDFRGSPEYRRHLAAVHAARVLEEVR